MLPDLPEKRNALLRHAMAGIRAVQPESLLRRALEGNVPEGDCHVLACGKAAESMLTAAVDALGKQVLDGFLVTPDSGGRPWADLIQVRQGEHPLPGSGSFSAGRDVSDWLQRLDDRAPLLLLLSGGGSAMLEVPAPGISDKECRAIHEWCLSSGWPITDVNVVRSRFSALKSGGLAALAGDRSLRGYVLSDVPSEGPDAVASGPFSASLVNRFADLEGSLPDWMRQLSKSVGEVSRADGDLEMIGDNAVALDAIAESARKSGITVVAREALSGDAVETARNLASSFKQDTTPGLWLLGGETTVNLPANPGRGGRNQQFALALADALVAEPNWCALVLASDGIDGNSGDAGALVDGGTIRRGQAGDGDVEEALSTADAGRFLEAAGDLVHIGPTGTNVMDFVLLLRWN